MRAACRVAAAAVAVGLAIGVGGCSGSGKSAPSPSASPTGVPATAGGPTASASPTPTPTATATPTPTGPVRTTTVAPAPPPPPARTGTSRISLGNTKLSAEAAARLRQAVTAAVQTWWTKGYAGGSFPRSTYPGAFATFTTGAARAAARSPEAMTAGSLGPQLASLRTERQAVVVTPFVVQGAAKGATAQVDLRGRGTLTDGDAVGVTVTGAVSLTPVGSDWQIFGFDITRHVTGPTPATDRATSGPVGGGGT